MRVKQPDRSSARQPDSRRVRQPPDSRSDPLGWAQAAARFTGTLMDRRRGLATTSPPLEGPRESAVASRLCRRPSRSSGGRLPAVRGRPAREAQKQIAVGCRGEIADIPGCGFLIGHLELAVDSMLRFIKSYPRIIGWSRDRSSDHPVAPASARWWSGAHMIGPATSVA